MTLSTSFPAPQRVVMADQMWPMALLFAGLSAVAVAGLVVDDRLFNGVAVWAKPLKFALSFVMFFATIALVTDRLSAAVRGGLAVRLIVLVLIAASVFETGYIFLMAGRGEASHFNDSSALTSLMYSLMGAAIAVFMLAVGVLGVVVGRDRGAAFGPGLRAGVALGFLASMVLTMLIGFTLGGNGGHFVGVPEPGARVLPLFGWSASVGDLRPAHFLALHAMQALPLLGWMLDRAGVVRGQAQPVRGHLWLGLGLAVYVALTLAVFGQALAGLPLIALSAL